MLFSSHVFIFLFLPITLFVYLALGARSQYGKALAWLTLTSLVFYAWWNPPHLAMILLSCLFNFGIGLALNRPSGTSLYRRLLLIAGIGADLLLLGYYKYIAFAVGSLAWIFDKPWSVESPLLPLAISFFTFQQIAYLVDVYQRQTREYRFMEYMIFVTWFPQLIAGPIVHHKESGATPPELWDFTAYTGFNAEPFPPEGDTETNMRWYWESSHFRMALGDLVLYRIHGQSPPDEPLPDGWGIRLTPRSVEARIEQLRRDQAEWLIGNAGEVEFVARMRRESQKTE